MRHMKHEEMHERVVGSLKLVGLGKFGARKVTDLSGGEQQRVALARALATRPRLLMFDEPLGALDRSLREDLLNELRTILRQTRIPAIYVTHDQEEAFTIADRVLILNDAKIIREGTPADVWTHPQSAYVAEFLGLGNVFDGEVIGTNQFQTEYGNFAVECAHKHSQGDKVKLLARPNSRAERSVLRLWASQQPLNPPLRMETTLGEKRSRSAVNTISGIVQDVIFQQDGYKVILDNGLYVYLDKEPKLGEKVSARVKLECLG